MNLIELFGEPIDRYTRAQAIEDGALIQVDPNLCREAGFRFPVAFTAAAWADFVQWDDADNHRQTLQDETGRLWDVLNLTRFAIMRAKAAGRDGGNTVPVVLNRVPRDGHSIEAVEAQLTYHVGPGDDGEPVITYMLPEED